MLVVLFHFILWTHRDVTEGVAGLDGMWDTLQRVLGRLRMPLLMAISGLLAASAVQRGWLGIRLRLAANMWLYFVWITVYFVFYAATYALVDDPRLPVAVDSLERYASNLVMPETPLWFVLAMALFPFVIWGMSRLGVPVWLAVAFAVAVWAWGTYGEVPQWVGKYARTFIFFAAGYYGRSAVPALARLGWPSAVVTFGTFVMSAFYLRKAFDVQLGVLIAAMLAIVAATVAGPVLFKSGWHARAATFVGKRTLEIYVLHVPLLAIMALLLRDRVWLQNLAATKWGDALFVVCAVTLIVGISLILGVALRRVPGAMALPRAWHERLKRTRADPPAI